MHIIICILLLQISHVTWFVCLSVCMLVTCMDKLLKNGLTDQDAVYFLLRLSWSPLQPTVLHCGTV